METQAEAAFLALSRCDMWIRPLMLGVYHVAHKPYRSRVGMERFTYVLARM